jgi:hypothetical protein
MHRYKQPTYHGAPALAAAPTFTTFNGVDYPKPPFLGPTPNLRGYPVGRKDHEALGRGLVQGVDENHAPGFKIVDDGPVVNDFLANIYRGRKFLKGDVDDVDRAHHARAEPPGAGQEDLHDAPRLTSRKKASW